jgi:hypothetical protein
MHINRKYFVPFKPGVMPRRIETERILAVIDTLNFNKIKYSAGGLSQDSNTYTQSSIAD